MEGSQAGPLQELARPSSRARVASAPHAASSTAELGQPAAKRLRTAGGTGAVAGVAAARTPAWAPGGRAAAAPVRTGNSDACVSENVQLAERLRHTTEPLSTRQIQEIEHSAVAALGRFDPLLCHLVAVKLVRNERRNFVNIRIHKCYVPLVHAQTAASGTRFFFCLSLHLEPFVNVFAIHPNLGVRDTWDKIDCAELQQACESFKARHGVHRETYRYDDSKPVADDLATVLRSTAARPGAPFSLAIRIATQMFTALAPTLRLLLKPGPLREVMHAVETLPPYDVYDALTGIEPALAHFVQRGRNGGYPELALYYLATIYTAELDDVIYDVHLSDKFEPFAVVSATHRQRGKLLRLDMRQVADLEEVLQRFRRKYSISGETYHYTSLEERMATDAFVAGGGASRKSKAHSSDFHLKIRISSAMCTPIFAATCSATPAHAASHWY